MPINKPHFQSFIFVKAWYVPSSLTSEFFSPTLLTDQADQLKSAPVQRNEAVTSGGAPSKFKVMEIWQLRTPPRPKSLRNQQSRAGILLLRGHFSDEILKQVNK